MADPASLAQRAGVPFELRANVVDVRSGFLAVEDPRPDLDRLRDRLGRAAARLRTFADNSSRPFVGDSEPLDDQAIVERTHDAVGRDVVERQL